MKLIELVAKRLRKKLGNSNGFLSELFHQLFDVTIFRIYENLSLNVVAELAIGEYLLPFLTYFLFFYQHEWIYQLFDLVF